MPKKLPPKPSEQLVPRVEFEHLVQQQFRQMPFCENVIGRSNPYTHRSISSQADYEEYVRERAFHQLCESKANARISEIQQELSSAQATASSASQQRLAAEKLARTYRRFFSRSCICFILAVLAFVAFWLPDIKEASYADGLNVGYEDGLETGYSNGLAVGETTGYDSGYVEGETVGFSRGQSYGYDQGYDSGYSAGYSYASATQKTSNNYSSSPSNYSGGGGSYGAGGTSASSSSNGLRLALSSTTVYVSNNGKIHLRSNCSGMKYYTTMTYDTAFNAGYSHCSKCF